MARKAVLKRIKFTKTGKLLKRKSRQDHFNAKESRKVQRRQAKMVTFPRTWERKIKQYLK